MIWLHGYSDLADALFYFMFPKHGRHTHSSGASLFLKFKAHLNTCVKNVKQAKVTEQIKFLFLLNNKKALVFAIVGKYFQRS